MTDLISNYIPLVMLIIGILTFVVSVIVEVTKTLPWFSNIPTDLEVIVLSMILTLIAFFAYVSYASIAITWYLVVGAIIAGFFVAFIAMYGWDKLTTLYDRFKK